MYFNINKIKMYRKKNSTIIAFFVPTVLLNLVKDFSWCQNLSIFSEIWKKLTKLARKSRVGQVSGNTGIL